MLAAVAAAGGGCGGGGSPATTPAPPARVGGAGFTFAVPAGFRDVSRARELRDVPARPEALVAGELVDGVTTSVSVVRVAVPRIGLPELLVAERVDRRRTGARVRGATTRTTLDGVPAGSFTLTRTEGGRPVLQRQVFAVRGGREYVITLTASPKDFRAGSAGLDGVLRSWRWR